jgi:hypothetical protein
MTAQDLLRFLLHQPFEPFVLYLVDGRTFLVRHPEMVTAERFVQAVRIRHDSGHVEMVDVGLIVSIRTRQPATAAFLDTSEAPK